MAEVYKLSDARRPSLESGSYELEVSWNVKIDGEPEQLGGRQRQGPEKMEGTEKFTFNVAGERFWLNPNEIDSVYPPEASSGDYSRDLAHIALSRDTLPWERTAKTGSNAPWLALLLFNQDEADKCPLKTITLQEYKTRLAAYFPPVPVEDLAGQEDKFVTVIELPRDFPGGVLPTLKELSTLCHARVTEDGDKVNSVAVVVSKRLPSPGRNTAHLVMLEKRFTGDNFPIPTNATEGLLISLKSWTFTSQTATDEDANATLSQLRPGWLKLTRTNGTATNYEKAGLVPLPHRFRSGQSGASWYAGPLTCGVPILKDNHDPGKLVKLPAESADQLLWFDEDLGMLNVTYAAAWELGRLLAMQNRTMFSLLHKWRSQQVHCHQALCEAATGADCCHLPQVQGAAAKSDPKVPLELKNWLDSLRRLEGIPYRYLLPDERLLPPDSVRFVFLDQNYINALLDGVLSSVRAASPCPEQCRQGERKLLAGSHPEVVTGFFLRSARVAGLPRLEASAISKDPPHTLEAYTSARLSPSILLYLFKGQADRITLRQTPDALHLSKKRGKAIDLSNKTGLAFAKEMMQDQLEELAFDVTSPPEGLIINGLTVTRVATTLIATWNEAPGATSYTVKVLDGAFEIPDLRPAIRGALALIDATRLSRQSVYSVQVRGNFGQVMGPYSDPVLVPVDRVFKEVQRNGPAFGNAVVLSFGGKIWAISGGSLHRRFSSVYSSPDGVHWRRHPDAPFPARSWAAGVVFGDRMWIFGGEASEGQGLNDIWSTMDGDTWDPVTGAADWAPRTGASAVVFQQKIWIMGGTTTLGTFSAKYHDIWSSPDGLSWTKVSEYAPWPARFRACIGVLSGQMFLMGGQPVGAGNALRDVWVSSDGSNWNPLPEALWSGRFAAASAVVRDILYVSGGASQTGQYDDLWATRDGSTWVQIDDPTAFPRNPWGPRFAHGLINHQNTLFLAGGDAESVSSVWRYRPDAPVPANMVPVLARSVVELNERVLSRSAPSARLSEGSMQPGTGTLMTSASNRLEMVWEPTELSETIALVACASSKPLTTLSWQADPEADVVSCAHWNGTGWTPASGGSIAAAPHRGQYFSMAALRGGKRRRCSAQASGSVSASLYALAPSGFPIPDGFLPVVASSAEDLIEELFRVKGASPTLRNGKLNTPGCSVTATGAAPAFQIEMSLGSDNRHYNVTNTIYACSNVALKQWNWLPDANEFAICEVWTDRGWRSVSPQSVDGAVAVGGLYFYRVEMVNARVMAPFGALIKSLNEPATVVFYVPG